MKKEIFEQAVALSKECLERYWHGDYEFALGYCANNVVWIGAVQSQFMQGIEKVRADFAATSAELKPCHLICQEYLVTNNIGNVCTVNGRYLVTTDESAEYFLQAMQRCTFVWEASDDGLRITLINVSNPIGEMRISGGEKFTNVLGKMSGTYMKRHVKSLNDDSRIVATGVDGHIHFLNRSEIVYACAYNKYCGIHTISGDVELKLKISDFLKQAGNGFAAVHRSYVVNLSFIKEIKPYDVIMTDGSIVPLPMRRYAQVRDMLVEQMYLENAD